MASNVRVGENTDEGDESYGDVQNAESLEYAAAFGGGQVLAELSLTLKNRVS